MGGALPCLAPHKHSVHDSVAAGEVQGAPPSVWTKGGQLSLKSGS